MSYFCTLYECPLEDVTEQQQDACWRQGEDCERCMIRADEEAANG